MEQFIPWDFVKKPIEQSVEISRGEKRSMIPTEADTDQGRR
jgi:hypothetical protein